MGKTTISGKNPITTDGVRYAYIEAPVITTDPRQLTTVVTASLQDIDVIKEHRWRVIKNTVVTIKDTSVVPFSTLVLGIQSEEVPHQVDGNPLNLSRDNLKYGQRDRQNEVLVNGNYAYITLPDTQVAVIDKEDAPRVSAYFWKVYRKRGKDTIQTHYKANRTRRKIDLGRFILGYNGRKPIKYRSGDYLDNRKMNLDLET